MTDQEPTLAHSGSSFSAILDFVQSLAKHDGEAFARFIVAILCKMAELDRDAYEHFLSGVVSRELLGAGLSVALEQAKQALASGDINRALERVNAIEGWMRLVEYEGSQERLERLLAEDEKTALKAAGSSHAYVM